MQTTGTYEDLKAASVDASRRGAGYAKAAATEIELDRLFGLDPADNAEARDLEQAADWWLANAAALGTQAAAARRNARKAAV